MKHIFKSVKYKNISVVNQNSFFYVQTILQTAFFEILLVTYSLYTFKNVKSTIFVMFSRS